jgi:hypothetical protein
MQMSKKQLEQLLAQGARLRDGKKNAASDDGSVTVSATHDPLRDQQLDRMMYLVEQLGSLSAAQFDRVEALLARLADRPSPAVPQKPNPCTLKVKRDARGFIDSIDVVPK